MNIAAHPFWVLRMRSGFEAADSGILIWRERPFLLLLFFAAPAALLAALVYNIPFPFYRTLKFLDITIWRYLISAGALWWCKPFFDRFALHIISKLFFNKQISIKEIVVSFFPAVFRGLAGDLTWRRFSPFRGAALPIRMLERQKRKALGARKEALLGGGLGFTVFLIILCIFLEIALLIGSFIFAAALIILFGIQFASGQTAADSLLSLIAFAVYFINFCIVETLWMAMSFAVYINSRVITEGWDLEIVFGELAARYGQNGKTQDE
jgi:hypothetical protein